MQFCCMIDFKNQLNRQKRSLNKSFGNLAFKGLTLNVNQLIYKKQFENLLLFKTETKPNQY